jgi:hypothetical protein
MSGAKHSLDHAKYRMSMDVALKQTLTKATMLINHWKMSQNGSNAAPEAPTSHIVST